MKRCPTRRLSIGMRQEQVDKDVKELKEVYRRSGERGYWQMRLELDEKDARAGNRDPLRTEPRFKELLRKIGLPE